jgi:nitroreductase
MDFQKPVIELIRLRRSCRTYNGMEIDGIRLQKLQDYIAEVNENTKIKARFALTTNQGMNGQKSVKLGTYGVISGAPAFIVGILDQQENKAPEFGYLFEKIVLFATDLGLQTCWLGGTFKQGDFQQNVSVGANEFIPIVSPVGTKKDKPKVLESVMRTMVSANNRKPWQELFFAENAATPLAEQNAGQYALPLEMVRLGPSASNKQPWRIIKANNSFHFFLCRTKGYGGTRYDMQKNDLGIAQCHFELAAQELGLQGNWQQDESADKPNDWEYIATWISEA